MNTPGNTMAPNRNVVYFLLALSSTLIIFQIFSPQLIHLFSFWPEAINRFQAWRFLTAHLVHFNTLHCIVNLIGLWLIVFLFLGQCSTKKILLIFLSCCLGIDFGLYMFSPSDQEYIGLSGALHGLAMAGALLNKIYAQWKRLLFVFLIIGKVSYENFFIAKGQSLSLNYDFIVATDAHAYGTLSGLLIGLIFLTLRNDKH